MSMMKEYAARLKSRNEDPGKLTPCQIALEALRESIKLENNRQKAVKYSLVDVESFVIGKEWTFSLTYEQTSFPGKTIPMIRPDTPVTEGNIDYAARVFLEAVKGTNLGRWNEESKERSMERIRQIIQECKEREEAKERG